MSEIVYKALLIGNSKYEHEPHELPELKGPPNDIRGLEDALCHPQIGLHKHENVVSKLNADSGEVRDEIERFFLSADRNDQLLLYYSGHGKLDIRKNLYLCTRDTSIQRLYTTAVPDVMIDNMIGLSKSNSIVVILDCCNSGAFKGEFDIPQNLMGEGRFVITSSRSREPSVDARAKNEYSAFTKHLIQALLSSEVDTNRDQFISLNEVYNYVLPRLRDETKQYPKRNFSNTVGEVAIGRSVIASPIETTSSQKQMPSSALQPILAISVESIEIKDVSPDEKLPLEMIDVYNQGGGELDWSVESQEEWIQVKKFNSYFTVSLAPRPGNNRGRIYVRDKKGGSKRIQVLVQMNMVAEKPRLKLSAKNVNLGSLIVNSSPRNRTIRLINEGDGELNARVSSSDPVIKVKLFNDIVEINADTSVPGEISGNILVESDGGNAVIRVKGQVDKGPILKVNPVSCDFGSVTEGEPATKTIRITNDGSGNLEWDFEAEGEFFTAKRKDNSIEVNINATIGSYHGSIFLKSNGGDKTLDVKARIKAQNVDKPPVVSSVDITGTWVVPGVGYAVFRKQGSQYIYQDLNMMGVVVSEGTASVSGNTVVINAASVLAGAMYGEFVVDRNIMTGYMMSMGNRMNFTFTKQSNATNTGFNWMNLFS